MTPDARSRRRYIVGVMILVAVVASLVAFSAIAFLQRASMNEQRDRLVEQARSQARLIEAVARDEMAEGKSATMAAESALSQVSEALGQYQPTTKTGEFRIARREGDLVVYLTRQRRGEGGIPDPVQVGGPLGVPMQRALAGQSGTMVGPDYRGVTVLAAYEPVAIIDLGIVAKIDLAEIRAPFRRAALLALGPTFAAILLGGFLLLRLNRPLLLRAREAERRYEELVETLGEGVVVQDKDARITYVNRRLTEMLGYDSKEIIGRPSVELFTSEGRAIFERETERRRRGEGGEYETTMTRRDGNRVFVLIAGRPLRDRHGEFAGSFGVVTDITELKRGAETLRLEKELAQRYFEVAGAMLVVIDREGRIDLINRRGVETLGYRDAGELIGREWFATCLPEENRDEVRGVFARIIAGDIGAVERFENAVVKRDGERRLILWRNTILYDSAGRIRGTLSSGEDITELRQQGERLAHLNAILRAVRNVNQLITREKDRDRLLEEGCRQLVAAQGILHAWVAQLDSSGRLVRAASAGIGEEFKTLLGSLREGKLPACCRRALATGSPCVVTVQGEECPECPARVAHLDSAAVAVPLRHEAKTYGVLVAAVPPAWAADDEELSLLSEVAGDLAFALHDLDETDARRSAEASLHESEARYRSLFENAVLGIYQTTPDGRILSANPALLRMLGFDSFEELAARDLEGEGYEPGYSRSEFKERVEQDGRVMGSESSWTRKDGSRVFVRENAAAVRDAGGNVLWYEGTVEDVSARREAEEARKHLEARLHQSQKLESIGTLASGIAHEINNPLTGIINYAQLIVDRTDSDSLREFARGIVEEGNRVADIVKNLLSFSRQQRTSHSPARIADIVAATLSLIGASLRNDGIEVEVEIPDDLPAVKCRSQQIQQVVLNLLTNARDGLNARYTGFDENKRIRVAAESLEHDGRAWVRLTVEDRGIGIPSALLGRVFDPFFTTKPRDQGTGLGLSISYGIARDHHGMLAVESEPNVTTRFVLELPVDNGWDLGGPAREARGEESA